MISDKHELEQQIADIKQRCDRNTLYISEREETWGNFQKEVKDELKEIKDILKPISETYTFISKFSSGTRQAIVGFSVLLGIVGGISALIWGWMAFAKDWFK